ncbi:MAG: hypothetical protein JXA74_15150 [Anaerolineae bacterium]|nr:hypothetical protein [Anaerolineae bacterium]
MNRNRLVWLLPLLLTLAFGSLLTHSPYGELAAQEDTGEQVSGVPLGTPPATRPLEQAYPPPSPTCPPPATPEPLWVNPVRSPTGLLYQVITVYLGRGRQVTASSEAGSSTAAGQFDSSSHPAYVAVPLVPDAINHITVTGKVEYLPGCFYTLTTTVDRYGNPLVIEQGGEGMSFLPLVIKGAPEASRR